MLLCDNALLESIKAIGKDGRNAAKEYKPLFERRFNKFKHEGICPLNFWFNTDKPSQEEPFHTSPALQVLAKSIFKDKIEQLIPWNKKYVPALTTNVQENIKKILSHENKVEESNGNKISISHQDSIIGTSIPAITQKIFNTVFKGALKLNSVTGHRLIRHFPQVAFDRKSTGEDDYRVVKYDRGASEISERLGIQASRNNITHIKHLVHAMAYIEFSQNTFSGNLIQLSKYKSPTTHRPDEAYLITVGTPLLPYQTFNDGGLPIPILKDPPLVGSNQFHANQYLLQMEIMGIFSHQSINLWMNGVVQITNEMWENIGLSCGISNKKKLLQRIQDRWTQDGDDAPKFLQKKAHNFYTLGKAFIGYKK